MQAFRKVLITAVCAASIGLVAGCSNTPSDEEMRQLQDLQAQVKQLEDQVATKQRENATLEKQNAEKTGKLQQCQSDQDAVKKAGGGQ